MRRVAAVVCVIIMIFSLAATVSASTASAIANSTVVSSDGTCQVTMTMNLNLDTITDKLTFPLPLGARGVTVNGTAVSTHKSGGALQADISRLVKGMTGQFTLMFQFSLSGCVKIDELGRAIVTVPMLSGFAYPVESLTFNITLPGEATSKPTFTSGYYQSSIESILDYSVSGQTVSGETIKTLKDWETLSMSIEMPVELFPQQQAEEWSVVFDDIAMAVIAGACLLYWLIFLRCLPPKRISYSIPPESYTAGEFGCVLTGRGADLTMMVLSWAQLGYILIHLDSHGRVMLHKRMEMGNERGKFENKVFHLLFGKNDMVDGTTRRYALLHRKVSFEGTPPSFYKPGSGNPLILRILACGMGLFGGMSLGYAMGRGAFLSGFVVFVMMFFGVLSAWFIQAGAYNLFVHDKQKLKISLILCGLWLLFGLLADELHIAAMVAGFQFLAGSAAAYGGRRTDMGRQCMEEALGLRRYLKNAPKGEFQRISRTAPDYFFSLAPYALALGVADAYADQFGTMRLPGCPYLTTGADGHMTAPEWMKLIQLAVAKLDAKQKRLTLDRLLQR